MTPLYASTLSRALLKACLGSAWLDHGEKMLESRYDHVREAVLGTPRDGYLMIPRKADPHHVGLQLKYWIFKTEEEKEFLGLVAQFYGITLATDSLQPRFPVDVPEEDALMVEFNASDLPRVRQRQK
jgi:hypothetical protein